MKLVEMKCKNCGAVLKVNNEEKEAKCQYCNSIFKIDDEVQHIQYDNAEQAGYEFEKGRMKARQESINKKYTREEEENKANKKKFWLVMAWIFLFPFTATYYVIKTDKLEKKMKIIIVIAMWVVFLAIGLIDKAMDRAKKKERITECYSKEVYEKLDELIGIDDITGLFGDSYTCSDMHLKAPGYKDIVIELDDNKKILSIKIDKEVIYDSNNE